MSLRKLGSWFPVVIDQERLFWPPEYKQEIQVGSMVFVNDEWLVVDEIHESIYSDKRMLFSLSKDCKEYEVEDVHVEDVDNSNLRIRG